jgi:hypothetical protein
MPVSARLGAARAAPCGGRSMPEKMSLDRERGPQYRGATTCGRETGRMPVFRAEVTRPQPPAHRDGEDAQTNLSRNRHHQPDEALAAVTGLHAQSIRRACPRERCGPGRHRTRGRAPRTDYRVRGIGIARGRRRAPCLCREAVGKCATREKADLACGVGGAVTRGRVGRRPAVSGRGGDPVAVELEQVVGRCDESPL